MRLAVPLYVHPAVDPRAWQLVVEHAAEIDWVVVNAADGPGDLVDGVLLEAIIGIRDSGITVLGYVDGDYGKRTAHDLVAHHRRWRSWYGVSGIFIDQVPSDQAFWAHAVVQGLRRAGATPVVGNPGNAVEGEVAVHFDAVVVFEGLLERHRNDPRPDEPDRHGRSSVHLVYGVPHGFVQETVRRAHRAGASAVWVTGGVGGNPYGGVPPYLSEVIASIRAVRGEPED